MRLLPLVLLAAAAIAGDAAPDRLPGPAVPATCGMQLKGPYTTPADLDKMKEMGIAVVRRGFHWEGIEKEKGVYDFTAHDAVMAELRSRGLRVVGVLVFANKHYGPVREEEGRAAFARYAAALAAHYKDDRVMWEVWNEPNTMTFWGRHGKKGNTEPYAEEYVNLVKATVPAMRAADPNAIIMAGSVSCLWSESYKWTGFCFAKGVLQTGIDAWSVHPYDPKQPEEYIEAYGLVRDMMEKAGAPRDFPMLNTERGFSRGKAGEGHAGGAESRQPEFQAWLLVRQFLVDRMLGMHLTSWYEWKNAKEGFGIFDGDVPSKAFTAHQVMVAQLRGLAFAKRLETASPRDFVLSFAGPGGARTLVAWTTPPPKGKPGEGEPHPIAIPTAATGTLPLIGLYGEAGTVEVQDGKVTVQVSEAPQYIVEKRAP